MDQAQVFKMQQEQHDQVERQVAQVLDLKTTYLNARVKPTELGMLTARHRKQYANQTGIVTDILIGSVCGLQIAWEDGSTSQSPPYMVTLVEN